MFVKYFYLSPSKIFLSLFFILQPLPDQRCCVASHRLIRLRFGMNAVNVGLEAGAGVQADGRLQIEQEGLAAADMLCLLPQVQQLTVERLLRTDERQHYAQAVLLFLAPLQHTLVIAADVLQAASLQNVVGTAEKDDVMHIFRQCVLAHAVDDIIAAVAADTVVEHFNLRQLFHLSGPGIAWAEGKALHQRIAVTGNVFHDNRSLRWFSTYYYSIDGGEKLQAANI